MNFSLKKLNAYCESHTSPPSDVLYELERETYLKTLAPQMMSGHLQGQLLSFFSQMIQPKAVLEIGTFTGYATICLAKGLHKDGKVYTIEANEELAYIIEKYIKKAKLENQVKLHIGDAKTIIPQLDMKFDIVWIDAGKRDYNQYFDLVIDRVKPGGYIMADNVLWSGKVVQKDHDNDTRIIDAFNKKIHNDPRVENLLLPIRDGLIIARKI